jgi:hypothetical protein
MVLGFWSVCTMNPDIYLWSVDNFFQPGGGAGRNYLTHLSTWPGGPGPPPLPVRRLFKASRRRSPGGPPRPGLPAARPAGERGT